MQRSQHGSPICCSSAQEHRIAPHKSKGVSEALLTSARNGVKASHRSLSASVLCTEHHCVDEFGTALLALLSESSLTQLRLAILVLPCLILKAQHTVAEQMLQVCLCTDILFARAHCLQCFSKRCAPHRKQRLPPLQNKSSEGVCALQMQCLMQQVWQAFLQARMWTLCICSPLLQEHMVRSNI